MNSDPQSMQKVGEEQPFQLIYRGKIGDWWVNSFWIPCPVWMFWWDVWQQLPSRVEERSHLNSDVLIIFVHIFSRTFLNSMRKCMLQGSISQVVIFMLLSISRVSCWLIGLKCVRVMQFLEGGIYRFDSWNSDLIFLILLIKSYWIYLPILLEMSYLCPFVNCWRILKSICDLLLLDSSYEFMYDFLEWYRHLR